MSLSQDGTDEIGRERGDENGEALDGEDDVVDAEFEAQFDPKEKRVVQFLRFAFRRRFVGNRE